MKFPILTALLGAGMAVQMQENAQNEAAEYNCEGINDVEVAEGDELI